MMDAGLLLSLIILKYDWLSAPWQLGSEVTECLLLSAACLDFVCSHSAG